MGYKVTVRIYELNGLEPWKATGPKQLRDPARRVESM